MRRRLIKWALVLLAVQPFVGIVPGIAAGIYLSTKCAGDLACVQSEIETWIAALYSAL